MIIGILTIDLHIPESQSLKNKRKVIKSIIDSMQNRLNISCAEVSRHDQWQRATLGIACVNTDQAHANATLSRAIDLVDQETEAEIINTHMEFV